MMTNFDVIVSFTRDTQVIGDNNKLPWHIPSDLKFFKNITTGNGNNAVIMGYNTWISLPDKYRPLPNRMNVVITSKHAHMIENAIIVRPNLTEALTICQHCENIFVIGGAQLYSEAIKNSHCRKVYVTEIENSDIKGDVYFPVICKDTYQLTHESKIQYENKIYFRFKTYERTS